MKANDKNQTTTVQKEQRPNWLPFGDGVLTRAGQVPDSNAERYLNVRDGSCHTVHPARIVSTGPKFSLATVPGVFALDRVFISPKRVVGGAMLREGQAILLTVEYTPDKGPVAGAVWPLASAVETKRHPAPAPPKPKSQTCTGTVLQVEGDRYAFLLADGSAERVFAHASAFLDGCPMKPGTRVSFKIGQTNRGAMACEVRSLCS